MKIEKGRLYYDTVIGNIFIAEDDNDRASETITDKIAVHCPTEEDWDYVVSKRYDLCIWQGCSNYSLIDGSYICDNKHYHIITIEEFKGFYPDHTEDDLEMIASDFKQITNSISDLLEYKNKKYGNAVLEPLQIFSGKCKAGTRLDDKLGRVKNSGELRKNDVIDLIGYLILTCKEFGWTDFSEFKD